MAITYLPANTEGAGPEDLGQKKSDAEAYTDAATQLSADHWNHLVDYLILLATEVGLSDGSTASSVRKAITDHIAATNPHSASTPTSRTLTAGTGLTGGGDLSANRSFEVNFGPGASKVARAVQLETLAGTSDTLADADDGKVVRCTNGATVTITVPSGLTPGTTVEYLQEGAGQIQVVGSSLTLRLPAIFNPYTAGQWSSLVVTILDTDEALVRGDLAAI